MGGKGRQGRLRRKNQKGPHEVVSLLGSGGMGEVYRARDTRLGRLVALKTLPRAATADAEAVIRFEREARRGIGAESSELAMRHRGKVATAAVASLVALGAIYLTVIRRGGSSRGAASLDNLQFVPRSRKTFISSSSPRPPVPDGCFRPPFQLFQPILASLTR